MKKLLLALLLGAFCLPAVAQSNLQMMTGPRGIQIPDNGFGPVKKNAAPSARLNKVVTKSAWFSFVDSANLIGGIQFRGYRTPLFPDSTVKQIYGDGAGGTILGYAGTHSYGSVFSPRSPYFQNDSLFGYEDTFKLDSVAFRYRYAHLVPGSVDTLIIRTYWNTAGLLGTTFTSGRRTATVRYDDSVNFVGAPGGQTDTILLRATDTMNAQWGFIQYGVNKIIPAKSPIAFTVTYKPGFSYSLGDTVDATWSNPTPTKQLNLFQILTYQDNPKNESESSYNFSLAVHRDTRYRKSPNGWNKIYVPGNAYNNYNSYMSSYFRLTDTYEDAPVGIAENAAANFQLGNVMPNPATGIAKLPVTLKNASNVKVSVSNIVGQEIMTVASGRMAAGRHNLDLNTESLKPGIYFYTLTVDGASLSKRFVVAE